MSDIEKGLHPGSEHVYLPTAYKEPERSPFVVTAQTCRLLRLYWKGILSNFKYGRDYLLEYTFPYLVQAGKSCDALFDTYGAYNGNADPESREAAHHAFVIFSWMHEVTGARATKALESGYSRGGILRAPRNKPEFIFRLREIQAELSLVAHGYTNPGTHPGLKVRSFRTHVFFMTAECFTVTSKMNTSELEAKEKEEEILVGMLEGVDLGYLGENGIQ